MANEICATGSLSVFKSSVMSSAIGRSRTGDFFTMTGSATIQGILSVAITATLIPLGAVTAPHWAFFFNSDTTNFLKLRDGASGASLLKLFPGEWAIVPLNDNAIPYAIADTAAVNLEYMIASL